MEMVEIVIRIPKKKYEEIIEYCGVIDEKVIKSGTVLPEGHGKLIDANKYQAEIDRIFPCNDLDDMNIRRATEIALNNAPTIIEADGDNENE